MDHPNNPTILVIRPDAIGDVVLTLPLLNSLKSQYPSSKIYLYTPKAYHSLLNTHPSIDVILPSLPKDMGIRDAIAHAKYLKTLHCDIAILPYLTLPLALMVTLANIPVRVGDRAQLLPGLLMTHGVWLHYQDIQKHVVDHNLDLLSKIVSPSHLTAKMDLYPSAEGDQKLTQLLINQDYAGEDLIAIQPCTGGSDANWPASDYVSIINTLHRTTPYRIILTGAGPEEERTIADIRTQCEIPPYTLTGFGTLPQLTSLLKKVKAIIGTNTGPLHIASALGTPVVSLFPSNFIKPTLWAPWQTPHRIVRTPTPTKVLTALHQLLKDPPPTPIDGIYPNPRQEWLHQSGIPLLLIQKTDSIDTLRPIITSLLAYPKVAIASHGASQTTLNQLLAQSQKLSQLTTFSYLHPITSAKAIHAHDIIQLHLSTPPTPLTKLALTLIQKIAGLYCYTPPRIINHEHKFNVYNK